MNEETQLFNYLNLLKGSNLTRDRSRITKEVKGTSAKTVQEYAKQQDIPYDVALKELDEGNYGLGNFVPKKDTALERFFRKNDPTYDMYAGKQDKELELTGDGKYVVAKNRPKGVLGGLATLADFASLGILDLDRKGGGIGGMATGLGYRPEDYNQKISKKGRKKLEKEMVEEKLAEIEYDPLGNLVSGSGTETSSSSGSVLDKVLEFEKKLNEGKRGERRRDTLEATALNIATTPIYTRLLEDAAKKRLELDKAMLTAREMMPSNIQNIMKSKQEQMNLAADSEYRRALGTAAQQTAANQFGAAGIQRSFGNVS